MKNRSIIFISIALLLAIVIIGYYSCKKPGSGADIIITPEAGTNFKSGDAVTVKVSYPADIKPDSIVYLLDSVRIASKKDSSALTLKTDTLSLGPRVITAKL